MCVCVVALMFSICCLSCFLFWFFFFFKQKTAYEMRISDWSSDVCSSDLRTMVPDQRQFTIADPHHAAQHFDVRFRIVVEQGVPGRVHGLEQIGRASCRERVCQYV